MRAIPLELAGLVLLEPTVYDDARGSFFESYNREKFKALVGTDVEFVQDNHSVSHRNVLRGLHYQIQQAQGKLVRCISGEVYDVTVDVRRSSPSFGRWYGCWLSAANRRMLWIPPGFAHGIFVGSERAEFIYKTTDYWQPRHERTILWNDPAIGVAWPITGKPLLSDRDAAARPLNENEVYP
jgi:dTDP-4-dehydrorhamnose 3,5-epimerase